MGYLKASTYFNVPKTTLIRLVKDKETPIEQLVSKKLGRKPIFNHNFEKLLIDYALKMESKFYGLTRIDLRRLAYQLAVKNNIDHPFKDGVAGKFWLQGFLLRNKRILSLRKPTGTSFARAHGFTKQRMDEFYDLLDTLYNEKKFKADRIFNVDETGLSIVQNRHPKVIARRGRKQIAAMTSAERGSLITVVACMSPAGIFVPPMIVFPRKNMTEALMRGAPVGSIGKAHPSGWIQTYLFTEWFQHFVEFTKPSKMSPVLLILDGHYSHTKNIELVDLARKNYVTLLSLPPHCTHKVQPMDRAFMSPLKTYYNEEIRLWLREKNRPLTTYDVVELFGKAYRKCQTGEIAAKGFSVGGIYPFNRFVFTEADYLASEEGMVEESRNEETPLMQNNLNSQDKPGPSSANNNSIVTPFDISPIRSFQRHMSNSRKSTRSTILSSSPYKNQLHEAEKKKIEKEEKKHKKSTEKTAKRKQKQNIIEIDDELSTNYNSDSSQEMTPSSDQRKQSTDQNAVCFFCNGKFTDDVKGTQWVQCLMCALWVHVECADYESDMYICDYCKK